jgi:hydroxymethylpyrimidine/phosphomethylpyrimidine kinase
MVQRSPAGKLTAMAEDEAALWLAMVLSNKFVSGRICRVAAAIASAVQHGKAVRAAIMATLAQFWRSTA